MRILLNRWFLLDVGQIWQHAAEIMLMEGTENGCVVFLLANKEQN